MELINPAKLQDTKLKHKNQWFILTMNNPKRKLKKYPIYNSIKKNKTFRNKLSQEGERVVH